MCSNRSLPMTREIVTDYFNWRLKPTRTTTTNRLYMIVRKIGFDCETNFCSQQIAFNLECLPSISIIHLKDLHHNIGKELFNDETITWTRIITFISFSALLAEYFIKKQDDKEFIMRKIIDLTTNFIDIELHSWLESQNDWDGCLKTFDKISEQRNCLSRFVGIFSTIGMLTLGALYMQRK